MVALGGSDARVDERVVMDSRTSTGRSFEVVTDRVAVIQGGAGRMGISCDQACARSRLVAAIERAVEPAVRADHSLALSVILAVKSLDRVAAAFEVCTILLAASTAATRIPAATLPARKASVVRTSIVTWLSAPLASFDPLTVTLSTAAPANVVRSSP